MSATPEKCLVVFLVILIGVPAAIAQARRARRRESVRNQLIRLAHERAETARTADPIALATAPSYGWLPGDLEDHLIGFLADNPDIARSYVRLDRARARQQQKGEL
ncbi:MAG: hypothetical protein HOY75_13455 [Streptomyces sp.]|nr:hypothetical protein [Streptomyces sp.]